MPGGFHPPPSIIASWPAPNYVDPVTKGKELFAVSLVLCIVAVILVGARLYVRGIVHRQLGSDDYFLALGLVFSVAQTALFSYTETRDRYYRHIWDVPPQDYSFRQMNSWIMQLLFAISTSCVKVSILLLYKRVIKGTVNRTFMIIVKLAIAAIFGYFITFFFLMIFQCRPVNAYWEQFSYPDPYTEDFSCLFEGAVPMANAIVSVVTDFLTALLPICLFAQVQLPMRQKISLGILFGIGFIVCILGIVRTVVLRKTFYETYDISYVCYYVWVCTVTENHLGVICAAVPPLRALAARCLGRTWTTVSTSNRSGANTEVETGSGYMLRSGVSGNRESETVADIYQADSESGDKRLTAASATTISLQKGEASSSSSWKGDGSSDTDGISDIENGRPTSSNIGVNPQETYSRT